MYIHVYYIRILHVYLYTYIYICIHVCTYAYVCICTCTFFNTICFHMPSLQRRVPSSVFPTRYLKMLLVREVSIHGASGFQWATHNLAKILETALNFAK